MDLPFEIPIDDPLKALDFCRRMRNLYEGNGVPSNAPVLSVVIPVYNEAISLSELLHHLSESLPKLGVTYEVVFIDDGSSDGSAEILAKYTEQNAATRVVLLSRNFGQQAAFSAGLDQARGAAVVLMDADLQDEPSAIETFLKKWREGYEVVFAIRKDRKERTSKRWAYTAFYKILSWLADSPIPRDAGDFCLLDRKVVMQLRSMPEYHRFLRGMRSWIGFKQIGIPIVRNARHSGSPKYTLVKLFKLALDGFMTSSTLPLRAISFVGFVLALLSVVMGLLYTYWKITSGVGPPGFATLVVITCFFSGIQLMLIGIVGEYIGRIFEQVRGRPTYIVREIVSKRPQS